MYCQTRGHWKESVARDNYKSIRANYRCDLIVETEFVRFTIIIIAVMIIIITTITKTIIIIIIVWRNATKVRIIAQELRLGKCRWCKCDRMMQTSRHVLLYHAFIHPTQSSYLAYPNFVFPALASDLHANSK